MKATTYNLLIVSILVTIFGITDSFLLTTLYWKHQAITHHAARYEANSWGSVSFHWNDDSAQAPFTTFVSYKGACDHDRNALVAYVPANELEETAKAEMLKSLTETIEEGVSSSYTQKDTFETLGKGVRQHKENGMIYIYGYVQSKEQIEPATNPKKPVNSKPLTLAKKGIEKACNFKRNRFVQFIIDPIHIGGIKVKGEIIELHP